MANKEKSLKRERTRLRKKQNPQQVDYKRMDQKRSVKTEFWKLKKRGPVSKAKRAISTKSEKTPKPIKEQKKKEKEPELEVIEEELEAIHEEPEIEEIDEESEIVEEEPEIEEIDEELDDLYSYDEDLDKEFDDDDDVEDSE
jgi:RNA polymerase primary sigma factor